MLASEDGRIKVKSKIATNCNGMKKSGAVKIRVIAALGDLQRPMRIHRIEAVTKYATPPRKREPQVMSTLRESAPLMGAP
jgi:hypothetical protein